MVHPGDSGGIRSIFATKRYTRTRVPPFVKGSLFSGSSGDSGGIRSIFATKRCTRARVPPFVKGGQGGFALVRPYRHQLKGPSRKLRKQMTDAEQLLWSHLRGKQLLGVQFNRQKPVGPYVVDFYAASALLVIEVDGSQHLQTEQGERDAARDLFLQEQGLMVLRFDDRQVLLETAAVLEEIFRMCQQRANPPCPPFAKGGTQ